MQFGYIYAVAALATSSAFASPVQEVNARNLTPAQCSKVCVIVDVLKLHKATPFCSSFLSIKPATSTSTIKVTSTATTTSFSTVTFGTASTSVVFKPGNPPNDARRAAQPALLNDRRDANPEAVVQRDQKATLPSYITAYATTAISSACSCLSIPTPTATVTTKSTSTVTSTITSSTTVPPPVVTSTEYPCATPVPSLIPTIPYGIANQAGVIESSNTLFGFDTAGATLEGCCNLCFFQVTNCIQAYWYFYEGCVVQQATSVNGTIKGISNSCPSGQINGLTYNDDTNPPFRSTGTIAGPCGQVYNDL